jgi:hypothetical protein
MNKVFFTVCVLLSHNQMKAEITTSENILHENMMKYEFNQNDSIIMKLHGLTR